MTDLPGITHAAGQLGLAVVGAFHATGEDRVPDGIATLILLGADGPAMWHSFAAAPEPDDGQPHPMDRWSERVISGLARDLGGQALFPFGGPPWNAFQHWAVRGEGARTSPVAMQVTRRRGLWTSYRGALGFAERIALPHPDDGDPCAPCHAPCLTACPADAMQGGTYDVPRCVGYLRDTPEAPCHGGCLVRAACPAGKGLGLPEAQRRFHMAAFLRAQP